MPLDPYTQRLFQIESGGNPYSVTGSNRGLGQFGPQEERMYGITGANRADPQAQADAVARERQHHTSILADALGRDPSPGELYIMHQQGIAGGPALLTADPNTPAWKTVRPYYNSDYMAKKAITGNIPSNNPLYGMPADNIATGAFTGLWKDKFEGGMQGGYMPPTQAASGSPPGLPTQADAAPMSAAGLGAQTTPAFAGGGQQFAGMSNLSGGTTPQPNSFDPSGLSSKMGLGVIMPQQQPFTPMQVPNVLPPMQRPVDFSGLQALLSGRNA
jgi:hypothetical protein